MRVNAPGRPRNGLAITRPNPRSLNRELIGDLAPRIQLRERNDLFVRGNLKDAIRRRVDDGRPCWMCSGPSTSITAVPEATTLPLIAAPDPSFELVR